MYYDNTDGSGFLAMPTPIPGAVFLLVPGLIGLVAMRRRLKK
jgi:hypothetical protein